MRPIATDGEAYGVPVDHVREPCKTTELIEMQFGRRGADSRVAKEPLLDGGQDPQREGAIFGGCLVH